MSERIKASKLHFSKWGWFVFVFFIVYCTDSALVNTNIDRTWARVSWVAIIFSFIYFGSKVRFNFRHSLYLFSISFSIFLSMLVVEGFDVNYIQRIVLIWLAYSISQTIRYEDFIDRYINFIRFLAIFSTVCIVMAPIIRTLPFPEMSAGNTFKNLLFTNVSMVSNRNFGPFWEPGAFQLYINLGILYEVLYPSKFRFKDILIFITCLLTTQSTAGILIMSLILLYYLFSKFGKRTNGTSVIQVIVVLLVACLFLGYIFTSEILYDAFFSKIIAFQDNSETINSGNVSTMSRVYSVPACLEIIKEYPIFGIGIQGLKDASLKLYDITSNTNSILGFTASFGIVAGILYLSLFFKSSFKKNRSITEELLFFIILFAMFSTENMTVSLMFWTLLFYEAKLNFNYINKPAHV